MTKSLTPMLVALAALGALSACLPTYNRVPTVGRALSEDAKAQLARESAAKASFNANDLSGCWQNVQINPPGQGSPGAGVVFSKTGDNSYSFKDVADVTTTVKIDGKKATLERKGKTESAETRFETSPYQIALAQDTSGFEKNQYGYQWAGKTCP